MFRINVRHGMDTATKESNSPITVDQLKADPDLRAELGYGDNINVVLNGVTLNGRDIIPNGSTVVLETAANTKAEAVLV